jgi:hypothetical protein
MLPWQLAQEYPTTAEEAFVKSGNPVFDLDILEQMDRNTIRGTVGYMWRNNKHVEFRQ